MLTEILAAICVHESETIYNYSEKYCHYDKIITLTLEQIDNVNKTGQKNS
jgi:hypothetical protein